MKDSLFTSLLVAVCLSPFPALADGVPEPGLVMYGQVRDTTSMNPVTSGIITWTVTPVSGGAPVTVSAALTNIAGGYSYRLRVPFEALLGSTTLSAGALVTTASPTTYNRAVVFVNGTNAATLVVPALPTFTFRSADRGVVERVDLRVTLPAGTNGTPAFVDSDGDGASNADELRAGTNPDDPNDYLHFTRITSQVNGAVELQWLSVASRTYTLLRSTNTAHSASNYLTVGSSIPGLSPQTTYRDTNAPGVGPYFYQLQVE